MSVRNVLVCLGPDTPANVLACAVSVAERFRATVTGLGAAEPAAIALEGPAGIAEYERARAQTDEALTLSMLDFEARVPRDLKGKWYGAVQDPTLALGKNAVDADLVIAPFGPLGGSNTAPNIGEAALTIGRPLLVLAADASARVGKRIIVAWKDGREARRALSDALPFLKGAELVRVVTVDEGSYATERSGLDRILGWLRAHDVTATGEILPSTGGSTAEAILTAAATLDADMVVVGAYGHSRLREWIFGGTTRELLGAAQVSLLLSN